MYAADSWVGVGWSACARGTLAAECQCDAGAKAGAFIAVWYGGDGGSAELFEDVAHAGCLLLGLAQGDGDLEMSVFVDQHQRDVEGKGVDDGGFWIDQSQMQFIAKQIEGVGGLGGAIAVFEQVAVLINGAGVSDDGHGFVLVIEGDAECVVVH